MTRSAGFSTEKCNKESDLSLVTERGINHVKHRDLRRNSEVYHAPTVKVAQQHDYCFITRILH